MELGYLFQVILMTSFAWRASSTGSSGLSFRGRCLECLTNGVACLDERTFALCINGRITNQQVTCDLGLHCTDHKHICVSKESGTEPICQENNCGSCAQTRGRFACVNETSYGFCYGSMTVNENAVGQCPDGLVCNVHVPYFCSQAETTRPSCVPQPTTTETTPTTEAFDETTETTRPVVSTETSTEQKITTESAKAPVDPDTFCSEKNTSSLFKDESDKTCKQYIYCYLLSGQYLGTRLKCAGYYNAATSECQDQKPADCLE